MTSSDYFSSNSRSYKKTIILRIVASIKYYLEIKDSEKAERGLITVLNLVGYMSSEITEVFFSYLRLKFPTNYNATSSYLNNLRPRYYQNYENFTLDYELLLCAMFERNSSAAKQMLLRLEESNSDSLLNMIRCMCAVGMPHFLAPNNSYRSYFTPQIISTYRMAAQFLHENENSLKINFNDQLIIAKQSHKDLISMAIRDIDFDKLGYFVLFPNFSHNFCEFVYSMIRDRSVPMNIKLRYLSYLLSVIVFISKDRVQIEGSIKECFDLALFVRATGSGMTEESELDFDYLNVPIFQNTNYKLLKSLFLLIKG